MKRDSVAMPMASAGIIGFSPDIRMAGKEIEPKVLVAFVIAIVVIVHVASYALRY